MKEAYDELARLGVATVYEAAGRNGLVDAPLIQVVPGSRAAGPARTVHCAQADNLMVHAVFDRVEPGDVVVLTMPQPEPVALVGELLATQAKVRGVAAFLVDAAVRDVEDLRELGLPVWARYVRARGADKKVPAPSTSPWPWAAQRSPRETPSCSTRTELSSSRPAASRRCSPLPAPAPSGSARSGRARGGSTLLRPRRVASARRGP